MLTDMLRENFRNAKLKSVLLPALGELVFLMARLQEHALPDELLKSSSKSTIPSLTFTMLIKCLKEGVSFVFFYLLFVLTLLLTFFFLTYILLTLLLTLLLTIILINCICYNYLVVIYIQECTHK